MKIFLLILFANFLSFANSSKVIEKALDEKVYNSYIWKSLIHSRNGKPSIKDKNFLLSTNNFSLKNELILNIQSIYTDIEYKCKFPARYNWLTNKYPNLRIKNNSFQCKKFNEYLTKTNASSLDLIFVSENIKNPSSMMGHIFFKINGFYNRKKRSNAVSFFTEINHLNIPLLAYESIIKGMPGYFILRPYEKQISSYINNEERNIWEYRLNLSKEQLTLIYYHLWELKDINLTYFFTGFNCATIIEDILSISSESFYDDKINLFITPKNLVNKANKHRLLNNSKLIPSLEWNLYMLNENMDDNEMILLINYMKNYNFKELLLFIESKKSSNLTINFIDNYSRYLYLKKKSISYSNYNIFQSLVDKFKINNIDFSNYKNPKNNFDSKQISFGSLIKDNMKYIQLNMLLTGNTINDDNRNYFSENSLKIGNINLLANNESIIINNIDLYSINSYLPINKIMTPLSSEIGISYQSQNSNLHLKDNVNVKLGVGVTNKLDEDSFLYNIINLKVYMNKSFFYPVLRPKIGLNLYEIFNMKSVFTYEYEYNIKNTDYNFHEIKLNQSIKVNKNSRIDFIYNMMEGKNKNSTSSSLQYTYLF